MSGFHHALVVDDLASSRDWLAQALALAFPGISIAHAATLAQARAACDPPPPLALIDLGLPDGSGVALIEHLHPRGTLCIVATVFDDDAHLFPALHAGAQGYVLKDQTPQSLAAMLTGIAGGQPPLSPSIARRLLRHFQPLPEAAAVAEPEATLTPRETEVLRLIAKGMSVAETAELLTLSRHTVAGYLKDIYRKLAVGTRAEATMEALRRGLVTP
ncbi:response regulator transcription factor [Dokdonella sp.]|uniref:LuxR C-terminal-related transcriptional regulator n=1 Tax=Dokdonella sp. TaxID=2291710 RepID=UPI0025BBCA27|nr:response regulator transcription factor [Dokdonella sp.]MBX3689120.1 response regulator transcription factor [Dokdonella sp.]